MVALSSSAMLSQSTHCLKTSHSRHVFVECFLEKMLGPDLKLDDVVYLGVIVVRHI